MLVTLKGSSDPIDAWTHKLHFELPALYFDDGDYTVALRSIFLDLDNDDNTRPDYHLYSLQTDLVDKSVINPKQEIVSFSRTIQRGSGYNYIFYEPALLRKYKIQLPSLKSTEFILSTTQPDTKISFDFVEILLEITRYARI